MIRRFREHDNREVQDLSGIWDFAFLGEVEYDDVDVTGIVFDDIAPVPGNFDALQKYAAKRGMSAYRMFAPVSDKTTHRLILDGVHHACRVFIDGKAAADHVGGFTRFHLDFTPQTLGEVEIVVLVDNRLDYERCPLHLHYFDWYHFGGIARGAELHRLGDTWIDAVRVTTTDYKKRALRVEIDYAAGKEPGKTPIAIYCDGKKITRRTRTLKETSGTVELDLELEGALLWSPDEPNLHELYVVLGDDDQRERVGIREVAVKNQQILINEQPVRLLGFNRHEAHPQFGCGLADALLVSDIQQLMDMGCNFVRGSHYPQDVRFLDLCDEFGICVWSETTGWQQTAEHLTDRHYIDACLTNADEMVAGAYNRPSVIMWGALNEGHSHDPECKPGYAEILGRLRELDASRPITYASNHPFEDCCYELADIISINCYPGWYGGEIDEIPAALDAIAKHIDEVGNTSKPIIISEIGAGAIYGWRDWNEQRWSEQYQAQLLETVIRHMFETSDRFAGLSIWQFGDCRTGITKAIGRPRHFNNKGVVDEYRRPKEAYYLVKALFSRLNQG
ncbi:MAG: glycoside hydrolase family 2 protein [Phycisphaerae bacterium]